MTFVSESSAPRRISVRIADWFRCLAGFLPSALRRVVPTRFDLIHMRRLIVALPAHRRYAPSSPRRLLGIRQLAWRCRFDDSGLEIIGPATSI
jgi:hypothetical protein